MSRYLLWHAESDSLFEVNSIEEMHDCIRGEPLIDDVTNIEYFEEMLEMREGRKKYFKAEYKTGTRCSICKLFQFNTPSGVTCIHGHGGAAPL